MQANQKYKRLFDIIKGDGEQIYIGNVGYSMEDDNNEYDVEVGDESLKDQQYNQQSH